MRCTVVCCCVFFFNDTATTEIYTLSLHDALPIYWCAGIQGTLFGKDMQPDLDNYRCVMTQACVITCRCRLSMSIMSKWQLFYKCSIYIYFYLIAFTFVFFPTDYNLNNINLRQLLATSENTLLSGIRNPTVCLKYGEVMFFSVSNEHYPVYDR